MKTIKNTKKWFYDYGDIVTVFLVNLCGYLTAFLIGYYRIEEGSMFHIAVLVCFLFVFISYILAAVVLQERKRKA